MASSLEPTVYALRLKYNRTVGETMARLVSVTDLLVKHGERNFEVQRCVFVKLGVAVLESDKYTPGSPEQSAFAKGLIQELVKAIAEHPNVSAPVSMGKDNHLTMTLTQPEFLAVGDHSLFHITLPKPRLKYPDLSSGGDIEDFYAIFAGSLFAVYKQVSDYPERSWIGQEFRELVHEQIPKGSSLKNPNLGPCPLRADIYLVARYSGDGVKRSVPKILREGEDLIVVFDDVSTDIDGLVDRFFKATEYGLLRFYGEALALRKADDLTYKILGLFSGLAETIQTIFANQPWRLMRSRRLHRQARTQLSSIHQGVVERETRMLRFSQSREIFFQGIAEHPVLFDMKEHFRRELGDEVKIPDSLTPALAYFENQLTLALNIRTLLGTAIVGAVIGAVLASLLTWSLGRFGQRTGVPPSAPSVVQDDQSGAGAPRR